jgi:general secretion pathway protein H
VKYRAECAEGAVTARMDRDEELKELARDDGRDGARSADSDSSTLKDVLSQEKQRVEEQSKFAAFNSPEIEPREFPDAVKVSVWTAHQREPAKHGPAFLYFYPQGFTERAMIFVRQGNNVWTLTVSPLTGKTAVVAEELEVPRS